MAEKIKIKRTIGDFLNARPQNFPIDCELLNNYQDNDTLLAILGNIAGDRTILFGCQEDVQGNTLDGYVYLRTPNYPEGEIIYVAAGTGKGLKIRTSTEDVVTGDYAYEKAYATRWLEPISIDGDFLWSDFTRIRNNKQISYISPVGTVTLWAGKYKDIPAGYLPCIGQTLKVAEFPELYYAIKNRYGYSEVMGPPPPADPWQKGILSNPTHIDEGYPEFDAGMPGMPGDPGPSRWTSNERILKELSYSGQADFNYFEVPEDVAPAVQSVSVDTEDPVEEISTYGVVGSNGAAGPSGLPGASGLPGLPGLPGSSGGSIPPACGGGQGGVEYFGLPDLSGQFVVGYKYKKSGNTLNIASGSIDFPVNRWLTYIIRAK